MHRLEDIFSRGTTTSAELVELLNQLRPEDAPRLRHDHFMQKVERVLGKATRVFSQREACLMVMSYGTHLQAEIYDLLVLNHVPKSVNSL
jgi:hypothetical protein